MNRRARICASAALALSSACGLFSSPNPDDYAHDAAPATADGASGDVVDANATGDAGPATYAQTVLADTPLGYWHLDEGPGASVVKDATGNGNDGTLNGAVGLGGASAIGSGTGAVFDGQGGAINVGSKFAFAGNVPFSIEAWVNPQRDGNYRCVACRETATARDGYALVTSPTQNTDTMRFLRYHDDASADTLTAADPLPAGQFTHVVVTYDGNTAKIYYQGRIVGSVVALKTLPSNASPLVWGGPTIAFPSFKGILDEVAVYDHALSADRVLAHTNAAK